MIGLSSCSLRIGFASPGCMPSPLPSMTPLSMGQMSLLSNTQLSAPYSAYHPNQNNYTIDQHDTPLQIPTNPLQYLLQSRHDQHPEITTRIRGNDKVEKEEEIIGDGGGGMDTTISGINTSTGIEMGINQHDEISDSMIQTLTPAPQITKHLFPFTNELHQTNKHNSHERQIGVGGSTVRRGGGSSNQLFDTPESRAEFDDTVVAEERNVEDDLLEMSSSIIGTHREMNLKGMATPGLTPIARERRNHNGEHNKGDDDDDDEDGDDNGVGEDDELLIYGHSTVRKATGERSELGVDEKDDKLLPREYDRDEVRRRVSFGPTIEKIEG